MGVSMTDQSFVHDESNFDPAKSPTGVELSDTEAKYAELFSEVIWDGIITPDEREHYLKEALSGQDNIVVDRCNELVVEFARRWDAHVILKGLRAISDFEYEFAMAQLNRKLAPDIETVFMMASPEHSFLSSSGVKEIATFGGSVDDLVPPAVARRMAELFPRKA